MCIQWIIVPAEVHRVSRSDSVANSCQKMMRILADGIFSYLPSFPTPQSSIVAIFFNIAKVSFRFCLYCNLENWIHLSNLEKLQSLFKLLPVSSPKYYMLLPHYQQLFCLLLIIGKLFLQVWSVSSYPTCETCFRSEHTWVLPTDKHLCFSTKCASLLCTPAA